MSYQKVSLQSLYHLMQEVNPDLIFVQTRPEKYLKKFEALPKKEGVFSDREYL